MLNSSLITKKIKLTVLQGYYDDTTDKYQNYFDIADLWSIFDNCYSDPFIYEVFIPDHAVHSKQIITPAKMTASGILTPPRMHIGFYIGGEITFDIEAISRYYPLKEGDTYEKLINNYLNYANEDNKFFTIQLLEHPPEYFSHTGFTNER